MLIDNVLCQQGRCKFWGLFVDSCAPSNNGSDGEACGQQVGLGLGVSVNWGWGRCVKNRQEGGGRRQEGFPHASWLLSGCKEVFPEEPEETCQSQGGEHLDPEPEGGDRRKDGQYQRGGVEAAEPG